MATAVIEKRVMAKEESDSKRLDTQDYARLVCQQLAEPSRARAKPVQASHIGLAWLSVRLEPA